MLEITNFRNIKDKMFIDWKIYECIETEERYETEAAAQEDPKKRKLRKE